jgi:hypothetical protein
MNEQNLILQCTWLGSINFFRTLVARFTEAPVEKDDL